MTDPEGGVVNYDYNATTGLLSKVTDARNQATDVAYETSAPAYHRVTSVIRPADGAVRRPTIGFSDNQSVSQPSEDGDVTVLRGARHTGTLNADWRYVTNDEDRVKYSRAPDPNLNDSSVNGQKMSRGFDPTGNVNSFTSGETTSFTYDNAGENLSETTRGGMTSRLPTATGVRPTTHVIHRRAREPHRFRLQPAVGRQDLVSIQNNSTGMTAAEAGRIELPRNDDGTLDKVIRDQGSERVTTDYHYTAEREVERIEYLPGLGETSSPLKNESFTDDDASRLDVRTDGRGKTANYDYDKLDRIVKVTYASGDAISFVYDRNGNVTSVTASAAPVPTS